MKLTWQYLEKTYQQNEALNAAQIYGRRPAVWKFSIKNSRPNIQEDKQTFCILGFFGFEFSLLMMSYLVVLRSKMENSYWWLHIKCSYCSKDQNKNIWSKYL